MNTAAEKTTALTEAYAEALFALAEQNDSIVVLDADVSKRMGTQKKYAMRFPDRYVNVGIAEQNMVGVAAGLAAVGKTPFAGTFAMFICGRAWEQIRQSVAYPRLNVKLVGAHGGLSVGEDGATHQACEDIALMRALPHMTVLVPCDPQEVRQAVFLAAKTPGPVYIRLFRPPVEVITPAGYEMSLGRALVLRPGTDVTIAACGLMVHTALAAARALATESISVRVLNIPCIKPLDRAAVVAAVMETAGIVTVEDHSIIGGLGSAVAEVLAENGQGKLRRLGMQDCFGESGDASALFIRYGLSEADVVRSARSILE